MQFFDQVNSFVDANLTLNKALHDGDGILRGFHAFKSRAPKSDFYRSLSFFLSRQRIPILRVVWLDRASKLSQPASVLP